MTILRPASAASSGQKFTYTFTAEADTYVIVRVDVKASGILTGAPYVEVVATKIEDPVPNVPVPESPELPEGEYPTE